MKANLEGLKKFSFFHVLIIATLAIGLYSQARDNLKNIYGLKDKAIKESEKALQ